MVLYASNLVRKITFVILKDNILFSLLSFYKIGRFRRILTKLNLSRSSEELRIPVEIFK